MGFPGSLAGTTIQTLKLATLPSSIFFRCSFPTPPKTLHSFRLFPTSTSSPFLSRALSSTQTALQTPSISPQEEKGFGFFFSSLASATPSISTFTISSNQSTFFFFMPFLILFQLQCLSLNGELP